jgi:hypothetical protein
VSSCVCYRGSGVTADCSPGPAYVEDSGALDGRVGRPGSEALRAQVTATGTVVASEAFVLDVITKCLALGPMLRFVTAVLAYPKSMPYKAKGLLVGVAAIMGFYLTNKDSQPFLPGFNLSLPDVSCSLAGVAVLAGFAGSSCVVDMVTRSVQIWQ